MRLLKQLWCDTRGGVSVIATIMLVTVLALGATVGLITLRNQLVQEFGDVSVALESLDQSWSTPGVEGFQDSTDLVDPANEAPAGLSFPDATGEGK